MNQRTMLTVSLGVGGVMSQGNSTSSPLLAHTNLSGAVRAKVVDP